MPQLRLGAAKKKKNWYELCQNVLPMIPSRESHGVMFMFVFKPFYFHLQCEEVF